MTISTTRIENALKMIRAAEAELEAALADAARPRLEPRLTASKKAPPRSMRRIKE